MAAELRWDDAEDIAIALTDKFPEQNPLEVRFTDLAPLCDRVAHLRRRPQSFKRRQAGSHPDGVARRVPGQKYLGSSPRDARRINMRSCQIARTTPSNTQSACRVRSFNSADSTNRTQIAFENGLPAIGGALRNRLETPRVGLTLGLGRSGCSGTTLDFSRSGDARGL